MKSEGWEKVKKIFGDAVKLAPAERAVFLDESCGTDDRLRGEVESLLSSYNDAESFLKNSPVGDLPFIDETEQLKNEASFGHYEIVRQIGAGGMGEVYLATRRIIYEGENF